MGIVSSIIGRITELGINVSINHVDLHSIELQTIEILCHVSLPIHVHLVYIFPKLTRASPTAFKTMSMSSWQVLFISFGECFLLGFRSSGFGLLQQTVLSVLKFYKH